MNDLILNGHTKSRLPVPKRASKPKPQTGRPGTRRYRGIAKLWASRYVGTAIGLSSVLNAYAVFSDSPASGGWQYVGVAFGGAIPVMVWALAKASAAAYRGGLRGMAYLPGLAALALLLLSLAHCSAAIAGLTGSGPMLSWLMAVGIDYGLVASELLAVQADEE